MSTDMIPRVTVAIIEQPYKAKDVEVDQNGEWGPAGWGVSRRADRARSDRGHAGRPRRCE